MRKISSLICKAVLSLAAPLTFADLSWLRYDGDDATSPTNAVSIKPVPSSQPIIQDQTPSAPVEEKPNLGPLPPTLENVDIHQANGNDGHNGSLNFSTGRGQDRDDVEMGHEPFGSGIKEDG